MRRPIDQDEVGAPAVAVEEDLLAVRRNIEALHDDFPVQIRQKALLACGEIQQREVLQPQHPLRHDQTLPVGQKTVPIARVSDPDLR